MLRSPFLWAALGLAASTCAIASHKIYVPAVEQGEWELELTTHRHADSSGDVDGQWAHQFDLEYAPLSWWRTELTGSFEHRDSRRPDLNAIEWENIFVLTAPGTRWLDAGIALEYEHALDDGAHDAIELGALLHKAVGRAATTLNLFAEKELGGGESEIELEYAARFLWNAHPRISPTVEVFGELEDSAHSVGPGAMGRLQFGKEAQVKYELAVLSGVSSAAPDWTLRFAIELEI